MFGIFGKGDPFRDLVKRTNQLTTVIIDARGRMNRVGRTIPPESDPIVQLYRPHDELRRYLRVLGKSRKTMGYLPPFHVSKLISSHRSLVTAVRAMNRDEEKWSQVLVPGQPIRNEITRHLKRLNSAFARLVEHVNRHPELHREAMDPMSLERCKKLHKAITGIDRRLAKKIRHRELEMDSWAAPEINWDDPKQVGKKAQIWLLSRIWYQVWEIRHRSKAPGRPLVHLMDVDKFPDPEFLVRIEEHVGRHDEYYIAAKFPRWKLVWKYTEGRW